MAERQTSGLRQKKRFISTERSNRELFITDLIEMQARLGYTSSRRFARYLGIGISTLSEYYNGITFISARRIEKLCDLLKLDKSKYSL